MDIKSPTALLYIALSIMMANRKHNKDTIVPDILYLGDDRLVMNLIQMFGGTRIYIPTAEEFIRDLKVVLYGYYSLAEGKSDDWFQIHYNVDGNTMKSIRSRLQHWIDTCTEEELEYLKLIPGSFDINIKRKESV